MEKIDETIDLLDLHAGELEIIREEIVSFFEDMLKDDDYYLTTISRIKTKESFKEKIIRQNLYKKYETPDDIMNNVPDIIGVKIECRFNADEEKVYEKIVDVMDMSLGTGYFTSLINPKISLKLDDLQPQIQKNGFEIYKIDGMYSNGELKFNFELQIKSLVNSFWGDIEHKILYKNYNYLLTESFIKDIMGSIKESLGLIDKQLLVVYDYVNDLATHQDSNEQLSNLLKKLVYDSYLRRLRGEMGFVIDFHGIIDLLVDFIVDENQIKTLRSDESTTVKNILYLVDSLTTSIMRENIFGKEIEFDLDITYDNQIEEYIGNRITYLVNNDFDWNVLMRILIDIYPEDKDVIVLRFTKYLVKRFEKIVDDALLIYDDNDSITCKDDIHEHLLKTIVYGFSEKMEIDDLNSINFEKLKDNLQGYLMGISSDERWYNNKENIANAIVENYFN